MREEANPGSRRPPSLLDGAPRDAIDTLPPAMQARVVSLFVYPVKACAGLAVPQLRFDERLRLAGDREWVVVDTEGQVTWQGAFARLALVRPAFEDGALVLRAEGVDALRIAPGEADEVACTVTLWNEGAQRNESFSGQDAGPAARRFLRAVTGADLGLVRLGAAGLARAGVNAVHLLSQSSLDELNQTLQWDGQPAAEALRFRPNIVLDGAELLPFIEDHLERLHWGEDAELRFTQPCVRCIVPNVNPQTGAVENEPGPTVARLSAMRRPGQPSTLGIYLRPTRPAQLALGTAVELSLSL